jgi:hypothetical protein
MKRKSKAPRPEKLVGWEVYKFAAKPKYIGRVEAKDGMRA